MSAADAKTYARIAEEAASWLERIERTIDAEEGQALRVWLKTTSHREAIVERCKRGHGPEVLAVLGELIPLESFKERVERHYGTMVVAVLLGVMAIGTMTVMFTAARIFKGPVAHGNPRRAEATLQSDLGQRKRFDLPDGGSILLNTATRARLLYRPRNRDVSLLSGEAAFAVKYDPARPFVVSSGARAFEVVGGDARFNLRKVSGDKLELTVIEGQVLAHASRIPGDVPPALRRAKVDYGEHRFGALEGGTLGVGWQSPRTLSAKEIDRRLAWQSGRVVFEDDLVVDALREIERYTASRFVLEDPALGALRVSGAFDVGDLAGMRRHFKEQLGIDFREAGSTIFLVRRVDDGARTYIDCLSNDSCRRLNDEFKFAL